MPLDGRHTPFGNEVGLCLAQLALCECAGNALLLTDVSGVLMVCMLSDGAGMHLILTDVSEFDDSQRVLGMH